MKENTQDKSLVPVNENSIFYKIKSFFKNLFHRNETITESNVLETHIDEEKEDKKNSFMEEIRKIEDEETKLLKLQKKYHNGEIKGEELSREQILAIGKLYEKQTAELRKTNEIRKQKLLEYRRKLQTEN